MHRPHQGGTDVEPVADIVSRSKRQRGHEPWRRRVAGEVESVKRTAGRGLLVRSRSRSRGGGFALGPGSSFAFLRCDNLCQILGALTLSCRSPQPAAGSPRRWPPPLFLECASAVQLTVIGLLGRQCGFSVQLRLRRGGARSKHPWAGG